MLQDALPVVQSKASTRIDSSFFAGSCFWTHFAENISRFAETIFRFAETTSS
jgi:hypothetical protein